MFLTEETQMIRDAVAEFADGELAPTVTARDETHHFDRDLLLRAGELGLFGITIPEEDGGIGAGTVALVVALEEIACRCPSMALALFGHGALAVESVRRLAGDRAAELLGPMIEGSVLATAAVGQVIDARLEGEDLLLTGRLELVPTLQGADRIVAWAGPEAIPCWIDPTNATIETEPPPIGMRAAGLADLVLEEHPVEPNDRFGPGEPGPVFDLARLGLAAISVGIARAATESAQRYARERVQFGREISRFGAIRIHVAEMTADLRAARSLVYDAAHHIDRGEPASVSVAVARLRAGEAAVGASDRNVQIHGGYGYVSEFPAERLYRDAQVPRSLVTRDDQERAQISDFMLG